MTQTLKNLAKKLPQPLPEILNAIFNFLLKLKIIILEKIPFTNEQKKKYWLTHIYQEHNFSARERIFLSIARFCHVNRPIEGYYFEFGCHGGNTMKMAYNHFRFLFNWDYVAFDSFEGLPEIQEIDKQEIWKKSKLKTDENEFRSMMIKHGIPPEKLILVKGFYDESLDEKLKNKLLPKKAAAIYIDCDLYTSTVPVLEFIKDFLQKGTIIVFDDWNCFHADPEKGERRAFKEFREKYPTLQFEEFISTHEAKSFVFLGELNK
ncbi:MAG: hypothetical protein CL678_19190 [Bdellovibrionaceae bacterium]|nr:hypothetical protein [Pseudobdellovibrionaceae bacterium]|tara:strand:+ start:1984 stop:2772 length:789 start_codon:yes stop_codon:yes gene_type:complete